MRRLLKIILTLHFRYYITQRRTFSEDSGKVLTYVPLVMMQSKVNAFAHITVPSRINFPDSFYSRIEIEIEIFPTFFEYALLSLNRCNSNSLRI
mmetsp:Transcript_16279/g.40095  ORF Transcript_16279/g.40095 Transcript_16279/m.40095 type:complete len:94 (-) Transcript_16279:535-816(-)